MLAVPACRGGEQEHHGDHEVHASPGLPPRAGESPQAEQGAPAYEGPKLVVVLVVEQLPAELLTRFEPEYRAGLASLLRDGLVFRNGFSGHGLPQRVAAHATLATGAYPSDHGLMGPRQLENGAVVESTVDEGRKLVGAGTDRDALAAHRLLVPTIGDRLRETRPESKVYALGLDGGNTVAMAGRKPTAAFWYDTWTGDFVSSEAYTKQLPVWLTTFNANDRPQALMRESWTLLRDPEYYEGRAREDAAPFEFDGEHTVFPHEMVDGTVDTREIVYRPAADRVLLEAAQRMVTTEAMGKDGGPDLLLVSLGAGSKVIERYGPNSVEAADYVAQLDRFLGRFIGAVDKEVGASDWMLVVTSDRGATPRPEGWLDGGPPGVRITQEALLADLARVAKPVVGEAGVELPEFRWEAAGVRLDFGADVAGEEAARVTTAIAQVVGKELDYIEDAFSKAELADPKLSGRMYLSEMRRSFRAERSPDLILRLAPRTSVVDADGAVISAGPYSEDSAIPFIVRMPGLEARELERPVFSVDLLPTLVRLFALPESDDKLPGAAIVEVFGEDP